VVTAFDRAFSLLKEDRRRFPRFRSKYPGNCKVCGTYIPAGTEVEYNTILGGIQCPFDCGRNYIV
jgi:hypothetical protein